MVSGFVGNLQRALRCWRRDPRLPVIVLVIWALETIPIALSLTTHTVGLGLLSSVFMLATLGFLGALRVWYLEIEEGRRVPGTEVYVLSRSLWKRFFGLGVYTVVLMLVPSIAFAAIRSVNEVAGTIALFVLLLVVDVMLTFATVVLSFFEMTAGEAVRYSWAVTKAQWPASAPYVIAAPLALHLTFMVVPAAEMPAAVYLVISLAIALLALLCKGATLFFYSDRYFAAADEPALPSPPPPTT